MPIGSNAEDVRGGDLAISLMTAKGRSSTNRQDKSFSFVERGFFGFRHGKGSPNECGLGSGRGGRRFGGCGLCSRRDISKQGRVEWKGRSKVLTK